MSIHRPAQAISRLIDELSSPDALRRETAVARLAVIGSPAVVRLISLASDDGAPQPARLSALQALERIGDPRAAKMAASLIDGTDDVVAIAAIGVLGPIARHKDARSAAALERLAGLALSGQAPTDQRLAALSALEGLPDRLVGPILAALANDPATRIASRATRRRSALAPLDVIVARGVPDDPVAVAAAVREDADRTSATVLRRLIEVLRGRERNAPGSQREAWMVVRGLVHQSLAARDSRVALYDLRETLEEADGPLPIGFLAAAARVGNASCLEPIAASWGRARAGDRWWRDHLAEAFGAIVKREQIRRRHPAMKNILERWPAAAVLVAEAKRA